jgi:hypothetical protein
MLSFQHGDPNGTRTRVFAVKGNSALESSTRPAFHRSFRSLRINGLRSRGDAQAIPAEWWRREPAPCEARVARSRSDAPKLKFHNLSRVSGNG